MRYVVYEYPVFVKSTCRIKTAIATFRDKEDAECWAHTQKRRFGEHFGYCVKEQPETTMKRKSIAEPP